MRQSYRTNPAQKHFEIYTNFSGGLNTVADRATLAPNEFSDLVNMDIGAKGTPKKRYGFKRHLDKPEDATGKVQGYFRLYLENGVIHELRAVGGRLYGDEGHIPIEGLEDGFQAERQIEAVQYRKELYIATGSGLVMYDGETAKLVEPYKPDPLEALYVGTNGLAENPDQYLQDGEASFLRLDGVTFSMRYGVINTPVTLSAYVSKPSEMTVEYRFMYKKEIDMEDDWKEFRGWSTERSAEFVPDDATSYQFKITAREKGNTDEFYYRDYLVPRYTVKPAEDEADDYVPTNNIHACNRILLYWDRLIMYGDPEQPDAIYISHLNNPAYFPTPNSLRFLNVEQEGITKLYRYRDMLIAFTPSSIQALHGKSPLDFYRIVLQTNIGCIAPNAVASVDNHVAFLSQDGIYVLKAMGYTENRANVERIDTNVQNLITRDEDVIFLALDGELHVVMPQKKTRLRYYYNRGRVWTKDESPIFDFINMYDFNGVMYALRENGDVITPDEVYNDDGIQYDAIFETMDFSFGQPNHIKKLKELQLTLVGTGDIYIDVFLDDNKVMSASHEYAKVGEDRYVTWEKEEKPTWKRYNTAFGSWELGESALGFPERIGKFKLSGRCTRTRVRVTHKGESNNELISVAYVFKTKKP